MAAANNNNKKNNNNNANKVFISANNPFNKYILNKTTPIKVINNIVNKINKAVLVIEKDLIDNKADYYTADIIIYYMTNKGIKTWNAFLAKDVLFISQDGSNREMSFNRETTPPKIRIPENITLELQNVSNTTYSLSQVGGKTIKRKKRRAHNKRKTAIKREKSRNKRRTIRRKKQKINYFL